MRIPTTAGPVCRASLLTVTARACDLLEGLKPIGKQARKEVLQDLREAEWQRLQRTLQKIRSRPTESRTQAA